jgi:hypothetical protein
LKSLYWDTCFKVYMCETDATDVSKMTVLDCVLTELVTREDFVRCSCRQRFVIKFDIKVLFGGGSDWATRWTVRGSNPRMCKIFLSRTSKQALIPIQPPMRRLPVLFLGWKTAGFNVNRWLTSSAEVRKERSCNSVPRMCLRRKLLVAGPSVRIPGLSAGPVRMGFYGGHRGTGTVFPPSTSPPHPRLHHSINATYSLI